MSEENKKYIRELMKCSHCNCESYKDDWFFIELNGITNDEYEGENRESGLEVKVCPECKVVVSI